MTSGNRLHKLVIGIFCVTQKPPDDKSIRKKTSKLIWKPEKRLGTSSRSLSLLINNVHEKDRVQKHK